MFKFNFRSICLFYCYMNLVASVADIGFHAWVVSVLSNGFKCDIQAGILTVFDVRWLYRLLLVINFGTHGFYPFPYNLHDLRSYYNGVQLVVEPRCYPGMLHLNLKDVINFFINVIWLKFAIGLLTAVQKKYPKQMRMFFRLSMVKLAVQTYYTIQMIIEFEILSCFVMAGDFLFSVIFLTIIDEYISQVQLELSQEKLDQPPSYIECLINTPLPKEGEKKDSILVIEGNYPQLPTETKSKERF